MNLNHLNRTRQQLTQQRDDHNARRRARRAVQQAITQTHAPTLQTTSNNEGLGLPTHIAMDTNEQQPSLQPSSENGSYKRLTATNSVEKREVIIVDWIKEIFPYLDDDNNLILRHKWPKVDNFSGPNITYRKLFKDWPAIKQ
ncbi:hypothetical protein KSP39_PZI005183 [Platanthera zijinensis]|uniref:Uncharacterized protein n=1 Tax=Platanthera zijinensis TaxID=2320716 RepID=A0AAP0BT25_9ASPA